ncbi:MAG: hypothetical protein ACR2NP_10255 [Pirellulaceae bacterium]
MTLSSYDPVVAQLGLNEPETVILTTGHRVPGRVGSLDSMGVTTQGVSSDSSNYGIVLIDDDVRQVFVSRFNVADIVPLERFEEEFEIWQKVHDGDGESSEIGPILYIGPIDDYGRRLVTTLTARGRETVIQGITRINPRFVEFQGVVNTVGPERHWNVYQSLSSIPTTVLTRLLERQIKDVDDANERIRLVDFYAQARKYKQAEEALQDIRRDFPGLREELKKRGDLLAGQIARQILDEANLRRRSGQPRIALAMAQKLENRLGIATAILVEVNDLQKQLADDQKRVESAGTMAVELAERVLAQPDIEGELKAIVELFAQELKNELSLSNVDRLSTFTRLADDADETDEQKLALALSGWIVGAGSAKNNLGEAQSMVQARALVIEYLQTPRAERRLEILKELEQLEAGAPEYLDKIVKHIKPPLAPSPAEIAADRPIELSVEIPAGPGKPPEVIRCLVQLPPEYDPWRRYPCIMSLGGGTRNTAPDAQIDWWCGAFHQGLKMRTGHAARHGFIVIAPDWMKPGQPAYEFSAREHAAVLASLRSAQRRFSIDTDRVFLSGHYAGANAAWDIGQAHPEHWTGIIPISARASKYINHYRDNGRHHTSWYFVNGARDFDSKRANATVWNARMLSADFESVIVHYRGRGEELFSDELPYLFEWMEPQRRQFDVREFQCSTMRPWDNYFWWFEMDLAGTPQMLLPEEDWNSANRRDREITGEVKTSRPNLFYLRGAPDDATLWLLPELVDFSLDVEIEGQSGKFSDEVRPSRTTLLEDVRTRGDRQHPYWARIVRRNKRWSVEE